MGLNSIPVGQLARERFERPHDSERRERTAYEFVTLLAAPGPLQTN